MKISYLYEGLLFVLLVLLQVLLLSRIAPWHAPGSVYMLPD